MREITTHYDGHGLNESIKITAGGPGPGGASHIYNVYVETNAGGVHHSANVGILFQKGPRNVEGSTAGITDIALLAIVRDRLDAFQRGDYACEENGEALTLIVAAMRKMKQRADNRAERGVLGTYEK